MKKFCSLLVLSVFLSLSVSFAAENISVRAEINKGAITIGEKVQYTVLVRHSPKIRLLGSIEFPNPGEFHVGASKEIAPLKDKDIVSAGKRFEISAFGLGEFVIEEIPIQYLDEKGIQHEIRSNRLYITVESVDKSGKVKTDIKGIKGPAELTTKLLPWVLGGSGLTLFLVLTFTIWWFFIRKKQLAAKTQKETLSPHDEAYQALQKLFDSSLLREAKIKEYYFHFSEIIRRYLERRYGFPAIEQTTHEIFQAIREKGIEAAHKECIKTLLEDVDIVKFSKFLPEAPEIILLNKRGKELIDKTKVVELPQTQELKP